MPTPLPESERRRFIEGALQRGMPPDRIKADLAQLEGYAPLSVTIDQNRALTEARLPGGGQPVTPQEQAEGKEFFTRTVPRTALAVGAGLAATPFTAGMSMLPAAGIQGLATGLGDLAGQKLSVMMGGQEKVEPRESYRIAKRATAGGIGIGLIARAGGEFVGIARDLIRRAGGKVPGAGFGLTTAAPAREAEHQLGQKVQDALKNIENSVTSGRQAKQAILADADAAGVKVPVQGIVNTLLSKVIPKASERSARQFNSAITDFATRLAQRGDMTPQEFDRFVIDELDSKIFKAGGAGPRDTRIAEALGVVRDNARETLITTLERAGHSGVREANDAAEMALRFRESADQVFGPGKLSLENRLRNLFQPGHTAEQELLKQIGDEAGIDLLDEARKLATRRAFTSDPRISSGQTMGVLRQVLFAPIARFAARLTAPLQPIVGPVAGGERAAYFGSRDTKRVRLSDLEAELRNRIVRISP